MKAEIIAVGTELLLGQIVNTNARYLSQGLAALGIDVFFQTVVGDNAARIRQAIDTARSRADLLLFTGGLGPTMDDLTKDVLGDYLGRRLVVHEPTMEAMERFFASRGSHMVESNRRQANWIEGSAALENDAGLAVGNALEQDGTRYILLPGPPKEMMPMFEGPATRWLLAELGAGAPLHSRILRFAGIGESRLEHELIDLIESQSDPTIAPYAKEGEVAIRLSSKSADEAQALDRIERMAQQIRERLGAHIYAEEDISLEEAVLRRLRTRRMRVSVAESCTGGLLAELITGIPGSSGEFLGGIVTYTNTMKHKLLGIPLAQLEGADAPGAVSASTAALMAQRVAETTGSDWGVSITGVAGPGSSEGKPIGLVYIGIARKGGEAETHELNAGGNRDMVRIRAAKHALYRLWLALQE
ncbi:Competence/damage-inducible protein CinA [Paenibacillus pasadenensis]|uniref:Putative competence-damage inducible protein n=1 Tax=Paenibacillus pasadenensis TaxID=217090 RepID=A0A2N5N702_9BACL|nr:competence/damage-inducible protein A [Paenibacillus pasadenensis]PLT46127.1 Competence/damage-inducible protein CinA [Paenibacillus pasadenensis]